MAENFQKLMTVSNAHIQETQITIRRIITHTHTTYLHMSVYIRVKERKKERENVVGGYKIRSITCLQEKNSCSYACQKKMNTILPTLKQKNQLSQNFIFKKSLSDKQKLKLFAANLHLHCKKVVKKVHQTEELRYQMNIWIYKEAGAKCQKEVNIKILFLIVITLKNNDGQIKNSSNIFWGQMKYVSKMQANNKTGKG